MEDRKEEGLGGCLRWAFAAVMAAPLVALATWMFVYDMPRTGSMVVALAALGLPFRSAAFRVGQALALVVLCVVGWQHRTVPFEEYAAHTQEVADRCAQGPDTLTTRDLAGVWGLNVLMGLGGFVTGLPEVAQETLWMTAAGAEEREWSSDFAMRSPRVRAAVVELVHQAEQSGVERLELAPEWISWGGSYHGSHISLRVALALDELELGGMATRVGDRWRLDLRGRVEVSYPRRGRLVLGSVGGTSVHVDKSLYWALQERGWLHPYHAVWTWTIWADDPRLDDLETPLHGWQERLLLRLGVG